MDANKDDFKGHFHIGYDDSRAMFKAYAHSKHSGNWHPAALSHSLEELLQECRERGLTVLDGLTPSAIECIHQWMVIDRPTMQYVEGLWGGDGQLSAKGPMKNPIGFRSETMEQPESDDSD